MTTDPSRSPRTWPFDETPGEFAERLNAAYHEFGSMLAAVRYCLIEDAPRFVNGCPSCGSPNVFHKTPTQHECLDCKGEWNRRTSPAVSAVEREAIKLVLAAWDALPVGSHSYKSVQRWLNSDEWVAAITAARAAIAQPAGETEDA